MSQEAEDMDVEADVVESAPVSAPPVITPKSGKKLSLAPQKLQEVKNAVLQSIARQQELRILFLVAVQSLESHFFGVEQWRNPRKKRCCASSLTMTCCENWRQLDQKLIRTADQML